MTGLLIGWFRELPHGAHDGPLLGDVAGRLPLHLRKQVADYLDGGVVITETTGATCADQLASTPTTIGPLATLTDGFLIWPSDLSHYVRNYGVAIPDAALRRMESNGWEVPELSGDEVSSVVDQLLADGAN